MTRRPLSIALVTLSLLAACSPQLPEGVDSTALNDAVGRAVGSGSTCVLVADKAGRTVWRGGGYITCARTLPTCAGPTSTAPDVLKAVRGKPARFVSCASLTGGANTVGWAMGPVPTAAGKPDRGLYYVAVMEGERALPGREVQDRVEGAFAKAGL